MHFGALRSRRTLGASTYRFEVLRELVSALMGSLDEQESTLQINQGILEIVPQTWYSSCQPR